MSTTDQKMTTIISQNAAYLAGQATIIANQASMSAKLDLIMRATQAAPWGDVPVVTAPVVVPPVVVAPPVIMPPVVTPPPAGSKPLVSALPPGVASKEAFDEVFNDQNRLCWDPKFNPTAPWKRSYYFGTQLEQAGWEGADSHQGANDLQLYTSARYPSQYNASGGLVAPGTANGIETLTLVGGKGRISVLANTDKTNNPQLQQWYGGHPTAPQKPVKRLSAIMTTEKSFAASTGYFVARINVDALTPGCWPAWWLLPTPATMGLSSEWKEIDGPELMMNEPKRMFITYHGGDALGIYPDIWTPGFHDVGILITKTTISTLLDGKVVPGSTKANKFPAGVQWYPLLNVAVGGWDGQEKMEAPALPSFMDIDYVKVFPLA